MELISGTATITIDGATYQLSGPVRYLREIAEVDGRVEVVEPIKWPVSFDMSLQISEECGRRLSEWMNETMRQYAFPVARERPRRRAQWKDEQSRYGRRR